LQPIAEIIRLSNALFTLRGRSAPARTGKVDAARTDTQELEKIRLSLVADKKQVAADGVGWLGKEAGAWLALAEVRAMKV